MFLPTSPELPWRQPAVRDLACLLTGRAPWLTPDDLPDALLLGADGMRRLAMLDNDPAPLRRWLAARPVRRLGHYAEQLLAFWFDHSPHIELVAHNLVLRDKGLTLGEFDFLLRIDGQPWHLETCSKFYLQCGKGASGLVGPSLRDAWLLKQDKLAQQLRLSRHALARQVLPPGFEAPRTGALVRGCFFYRQAPDEAAFAPATQWQGWMADCEQPWPCRDASSRWLWLPRMRWLSPALAASGEVGSAQALRVQMTQAEAPQMVAEMVAEEGGWRELRRGFVLPSRWPDAGRLVQLQQQMPTGAC
ncbi:MULTISPECIES: DUF1853 family protein [unclassified Paludibacterium]|uniref:DUF1853 family protein n=1 Tax=unclassified Paludibacterium TaxID=2618429 RepID=UPI001C03D545|nr:DUF1853 family protein [Paludibacterium sp. B53371]